MRLSVAAATALALFVGTFGPSVAAAEVAGAEASDGPTYPTCKQLPNLTWPDPENYSEVRAANCAVQKAAWDFLWYYPPFVYQVWCFTWAFLGEDYCHCPHCPPATTPGTRVRPTSVPGTFLAGQAEAPA